MENIISGAWQIDDDYVYIAQDVEQNSGNTKIRTSKSAIK
jgi:hypothetical protein